MPALPLLTVLLAGLAAVVVLGFVLTAISKRREEPAEAGAPSDELAKRAGTLLLELDARLATADQDVGFAEAEFGEEAARPFREAVERARADVAEAFRLQQRAPAEVAWRCERAEAELAACTRRFEQLRVRSRHADEVADAVETAVEASAERAREADAVLTRLRDAYAPSALAPIAQAPEQARERLAHASARLGAARAAMRAGDASKAAALLGEADEAASQAARLLDAVDDTAEKLEAERRRLTPVGLAEIHRTG